MARAWLLLMFLGGCGTGPFVHEVAHTAEQISARFEIRVGDTGEVFGSDQDFVVSRTFDNYDAGGESVIILEHIVQGDVIATNHFMAASCAIRCVDSGRCDPADLTLERTWIYTSQGRIEGGTQDCEAGDVEFSIRP